MFASPLAHPALFPALAHPPPPPPPRRNLLPLLSVPPLLASAGTRPSLVRASGSHLLGSWLGLPPGESPLSESQLAFLQSSGLLLGPERTPPSILCCRQTRGLPPRGRRSFCVPGHRATTWRTGNFWPLFPWGVGGLSTPASPPATLFRCQLPRLDWQASHPAPSSRLVVYRDLDHFYLGWTRCL